MFPSSAHNAYAQAALYKPGPLVLSRTFFKKSLLIDFDDFKLCELPAPTSHMQPEEEQLISHLNALADCLAGDAFWPDSLRQTAAEAQSLFERADVAEKFDFVNSNNFSTAGMGSLNDGVVPETCTSHQRNLYRTINHLLRSYWKQLGLESHNYSDFVLIADGTAVRLIPGKTIFRNGVQSGEVRAGEGEHVWTVVRCLGPDITGMPHYTIRLGNTFGSARHESLAIDLLYVRKRKSMTRVLKKIQWKVFVILLVAGLLGVVAILPFTFEMIVSSMMRDLPPSKIPLAGIVALALVQNGVLLSAAILIGMILSKSIGLQMPLIRAWANGEHPLNVKRVVLPGILVGAAVGIVMVTVEALFFLKHLPASMLSLFDIPLWKRLLAGIVYGGFTEELFMRLFLLSLVAWLLGKLWKTAEGMPTSAAFWTAIILVAVLFGLGHLPATSVMTPLTGLLVVRAVVLNGIAGIAFGYLYWKRGLEAAMLAHMSTHVVLQIPGVILLKTML